MIDYIDDSCDELITVDNSNLIWLNSIFSNLKKENGFSLFLFKWIV